MDAVFLVMSLSSAISHLSYFVGSQNADSYPGFFGANSRINYPTRNYTPFCNKSAIRYTFSLSRTIKGKIGETMVHEEYI